MELLFVALGGAILGLLARYTLPGRSTQGAVLVPAIGTAMAALVWVGLTWLGWAYDAGWIWVLSLVVAALVAAASQLAVARSRINEDARLLRDYTANGVPT
ncbi:MAG: hypothetical protein R6W83_09165 [Cryobacterium sp.]